MRQWKRKNVGILNKGKDGDQKNVRKEQERRKKGEENKNKRSEGNG